MTGRRHIIVEPLRPEQAAVAYALLRATMSDLSYEQWADFVQAQMAPPPAPGFVLKPPPNASGILLARDESELLLGLAAYRRHHHLRHGPILLADHLIALGLIDWRPVARRLAEALEELATELGCRAVQLNLTRSGPLGAGNCTCEEGALARLLQEAGHRPEGLALCKPLPAPPPA